MWGTVVRRALLLGMIAATAHAKPFIFYRSILNAASYAPQGLPNGAVARGSIFSIFGRGLGPVAGVTANAFPLGTSLGGVTVDVCQGSTCVSALPLFVNASQVNAIMPSNAPLGAVNVRVNYQNEAGNFSPARVVAASFGSFAVSSGGFGPSIVQNFVSATELPLNSATASARPGQVVILWGTGLGAGLNADNVAAQAGDLPAAVEIFVGSATVTNRLYSGRSPCCSGVDQIVFEIPSNAPTGCFVPVTVRVNGQIVSNSTTIAISTDGSACSDPLNPLRSARGGGKTGVVMLNRFHTSFLAVSYNTDMFAGVFQDEPIGPWHFNRFYSLPPAGSCATYSANQGTLGPSLLVSLATNGRQLVPGATISISNGSTTQAGFPLPGTQGFIGQTLGTDAQFEIPLPLFFRDASPHRISASAGSGVGAFEISLTPPERLTWTNRESFAVVNRGAQTEVTWTGGDPQGLVAVIGSGHSSSTLSGGGFLCVARASQGRFTVPTWATESLPDRGPTAPNGEIAVIALPANATTFQASGLDRGFGVFTSGQIRGVEFR